jgi:hypothetical protein
MSKAITITRRSESCAHWTIQLDPPWTAQEVCDRLNGVGAFVEDGKLHFRGADTGEAVIGVVTNFGIEPCGDDIFRVEADDGEEGHEDRSLPCASPLRQDDPTAAAGVGQLGETPEPTA